MINIIGTTVNMLLDELLLIMHCTIGESSLSEDYAKGSFHQAACRSFEELFK